MHGTCDALHVEEQHVYDILLHFLNWAEAEADIWSSVATHIDMQKEDIKNSKTNK